MKREQVFSGNMIFASKNAFNMQTQSRRDDLISLCYFLLYLVDGDLAFLEQNSESSKENSQDASKQREEFLRIQKFKNQLTPELLCASPESKHFLRFINLIFSLKFEETPNYEKLRFMLVTELLDLGESPSKKYDWNENMFNPCPSRYQFRRQINNMSCESVEFNENDMDENGGIQMQDEFEVGSQLSDQQMAVHSNLDEKMKNMHGYNFKNNENFKAMKKIIPVLCQDYQAQIEL